MTTATELPSARVTRERLSYGPGSPHSWFRDLLLMSEARARADEAVDHPRLRGRDPGPTEPAAWNTPRNLEDVHARLKAAAHESAKFDLSTSSGLMPTGQMTPTLAERFAAAARSRAALANALGFAPIPEGTGMTATEAALTGGASVAVQATQNTGVSNTDPTFGLASATIAYAAGYVDVSRQLFDRAGAGSAARLDRVLATELGRAAGERIDVQILNGSGTSGETTGLLVLSGTVSTAYTDASPTVAEMCSKLGNNYADMSLATNYGAPPDLLVLHPRRNAWANSQADTAGQPVVPRMLSLFDQVVEAPAMPVTLGAGTEDAAITIRTEGVNLYLNPPQIQIFEEVKSGNLEVRIRALTSLVLVVPLAKAVGKVTGTGMIAPVFA